MKREAVNHPSHYQAVPRLVREAADVIDMFKLGFNLGNTVKYVLRAGKKGDLVEDLRKAAWYLSREIDNLEAARKNAKRAAKR